MTKDMPSIPEHKRISGEFRVAAPSIENATAIGRSMSHMGESVSQAADELAMMEERRREVEADTMRNRARLAIQEARGQHLAHRAENPDTGTWAEDIGQRLGEARSALAEQKMGTRAAAEVDEIFRREGEVARNDALAAGLKQQMKVSRQTATDLSESYIRHGDYPSAKKIYQDTPSYGDDEKAERIAEIARRGKIRPRTSTCAGWRWRRTGRSSCRRWRRCGAACCRGKEERRR